MTQFPDLNTVSERENTLFFYRDKLYISVHFTLSFIFFGIKQKQTLHEPERVWRPRTMRLDMIRVNDPDMVIVSGKW